MKQKILLLLFAGFVLTNCEEPEPQPFSLEQDLADQLHNYVRSSPEIPGAWLSILSNSTDIQIVSGWATKDLIPMEKNHLFRFSSITKMLTATVIFQLIEEEKLALGDRVIDHLGLMLLEGLQSESEIEKITIDNLLQHTSGIEDYVALNWVQTLAGNPEKVWEPIDLLNYAKVNGSPKHKVGKSFYYSDTNYVLLGILIETLTGKQLAEVFKTRLFDPLEMNNTYLESQEDVKLDNLSSGYFETTDLSNWSVSSDWAGGGIASTMENMSYFMKALVSSDLFEDAKTLETMKTWLQTGSDSFYGYGIGKYHLTDNIYIGHGGQGFGFTSGLYYIEELETIVCLGVNQQATNIDAFELAVFQTLKKWN